MRGPRKPRFEPAGFRRIDHGAGGAFAHRPRERHRP